MTDIISLVPRTIQTGLSRLAYLGACHIESNPKFDPEDKRWSVTLSLQIDTESSFVSKVTRWCVLIEEAYPFGEIAIYPAVEGGITATFQHQMQNTAPKQRRRWRDGKLCLDEPFGNDRLLTNDRDPIGDTESRLVWHIKRSLLWLQLAANNSLALSGDPFELPAHMNTYDDNWSHRRIVHDETKRTFDAWQGREGCFGRIEFGQLNEIKEAIYVDRFVDGNLTIIREWTGRKLEKCGEYVGFWWLWPKYIILPPWQSPVNWGELRLIATKREIDADDMLHWLLPLIRGASSKNILLLGYPISERIGTPNSEVHWDALFLPAVGKPEGKTPDGFRPNAQGWWQRDRFETFANKIALQYMRVENWSTERLQARGRLQECVQEARVVIIGVGALGSTLAEILVRTGLKYVTLIDRDLVEAGNVCRHVATLADVGKSKVQVVSQRLRQISPDVHVTECTNELNGNIKEIVEQLDEYDAIIDCTSSNEVLSILGTAWWSVPRIFASFSLGYRGQRVYSLGLCGHQFPHVEFAEKVSHWLEQEAKMWEENGEVLAGAGCWSPLFPVRHDDILLAAAICVKELETLLSMRPQSTRFRTFKQTSSEYEFEGIVRDGAHANEQGATS